MQGLEQKSDAMLSRQYSAMEGSYMQFFNLILNFEIFPYYIATNVHYSNLLSLTKYSKVMQWLQVHII